MGPKDPTLASPPAGTVVSAVSKHTSPKQLVLFKNNLIWGLHCVFVAAHRLSLVAVSGGSFLLSCVGFSLWWLLLLWSTGIVAWWHMGSSRTRDQTHVPYFGMQILYL